MTDAADARRLVRNTLASCSGTVAASAAELRIGGEIQRQLDTPVLM